MGESRAGSIFRFLAPCQWRRQNVPMWLSTFKENVHLKGLEPVVSIVIRPVCNSTMAVRMMGIYAISSSVSPWSIQISVQQAPQIAVITTSQG